MYFNLPVSSYLFFFRYDRTMVGSCFAEADETTDLVPLVGLLTPLVVLSDAGRLDEGDTGALDIVLILEAV